MSRIARPVHLSGSDSTIQDPTILRTTRLSNTPLYKKQSRFSGSSSSSTHSLDDTTGPLAADAPKLQRRSLKNSTTNGGGSRSIKKPAKTAAAAASSTTTLRSSVSSTEELSEPESLSFTANTTPRTSWNRSSPPVKDEQEQQQQPMLVVGTKVTVPSLGGVQGTLRFLGPTSFKAGTWAGIELDVVGGGKNDGCVQG